MTQRRSGKRHCVPAGAIMRDESMPWVRRMGRAYRSRVASWRIAPSYIILLSADPTSGKFCNGL